MGHASSRPRSRRVGRRTCFASTDAFVDVAGITAERAAEGSEWSSAESEEKKETAVLPRARGVVSVAAGPEADIGETHVGDEADAANANILVPSTLASSRGATGRSPPPAASAGPEDAKDADVLVFLFTNEKGFEAARPVTARLVVARRGRVARAEDNVGDGPRARTPKRAPDAPFWIGTIAERLAGHAGAWPAWDIRQSAKAKTLVTTQLEDFERAKPYAPTEPPHVARSSSPRRDEDDAIGDDAAPRRACASERVSESERERATAPEKKENAPPAPWSPDITESERLELWRYIGGGMHQPVAEATPAERWIAGKTKRKGTEAEKREDLSAVTAEALETRAEVALAVDGERALSPRAAAAAAEVARRAREAGAVAFSSVRKRAKTPPVSDTRLPLPATSLVEPARTAEEKEEEAARQGADTGAAAFSSAESSKLWGAWSPSVQRRRRRKLKNPAQNGRDDDAESQKPDPNASGGFASTRPVPSPRRGGGSSGRSSGYEDDEEDPTDALASADDAPSSSDFETPEATRDDTPSRDEEADETTRRVS